MVGRFVLAVTLVAGVAGCGPVEGAECAPLGGGVCKDAKTLLMCEDNGRFVAYPCPGPLGCTDSSAAFSCDFRGVKEGDFCPGSFTSKNIGVCDGSTKMLRCTAGRFEATSCSSCTESGTAASCQP